MGISWRSGGCRRPKQPNHRFHRWDSPQRQCLCGGSHPETYEEAGIWLGEGNTMWMEALNQRTATLKIRILWPISAGCTNWWSHLPLSPSGMTPVFILLTEEVQDVRCDEVETVEHRWIAPKQAISEAEAGTFFLTTILPHALRVGPARPSACFGRASSGLIVHIVPSGHSGWTMDRRTAWRSSYPANHTVVGPTRSRFRDGRW